jgi:hypothetical protein
MAGRQRVRHAARAVDRVAVPHLIGLSEIRIAAMLGRPAKEDETPPGKVWVYRGTGCDLLVHLFPDMERGGFYTLDYTATGGRVGRDACLRGIVAKARRRLGIHGAGRRSRS